MYKAGGVLYLNLRLITVILRLPLSITFLMDEHFKDLPLQYFVHYHLAAILFVLNVRLVQLNLRTCQDDCTVNKFEFPFSKVEQTDQHYRAKPALNFDSTFSGLLQHWGLLTLNILF